MKMVRMNKEINIKDINFITFYKFYVTEKLFDNHMTTMFNLVDELLERDNEELTEIEEAFLDAFFEYNEFVAGEEE